MVAGYRYFRECARRDRCNRAETWLVARPGRSAKSRRAAEIIIAPARLEERTYACIQA